MSVNRTARFKILYLMELLVLGAAAGTIVFLVPLEYRTVSVIALAALLFIPGRVQGALFRQHFRGRRLVNAGKFSESILESEGFLETVRREPWRKRAVWLGGVLYSPDIEAMTLNNIGAASLPLGHIDKAEWAFRRAVEVDPHYPIPHFNLAVLATIRGDGVTARAELEQASRLGYTAGTLDSVARTAQQMQALIEGRSKR
jgi:hypothetical protein